MHAKFSKANFSKIHVDKTSKVIGSNSNVFALLVIITYYCNAFVLVSITFIFRVQAITVRP